jgi:hypothetical protein
MILTRAMWFDYGFYCKSGGGSRLVAASQSETLFSDHGAANLVLEVKKAAHKNSRGHKIWRDRVLSMPLASMPVASDKGHAHLTHFT